MLRAIKAENMFINSKAVFACLTVSFVGFCVAWRGINANPDKVQGIHDLKDEMYFKGYVVRKLKQVLCSYPILRLPDTSKPFYFFTDSS
eukprot:COSAG01_NODE_10781_length_2081_cov_1.995964_1_plen_89_part_00